MFPNAGSMSAVLSVACYGQLPCNGPIPFQNAVQSIHRNSETQNMEGLTSHWPVSVGVLDEEEKGEELCQYNNNNNNNNNNITDNIHIGQCAHIPESTTVKAQNIHHGSITCAVYCNHRASATLHTPEILFVSGI
jgi:hypothetical protein